MLIPRRGIEYFGNLAFVGGGGGGDGGFKGRAAIGFGTQTRSEINSPLHFGPAPKYDLFDEIDVLNSRFVAASDGYYYIYSVVEISTAPFVGQAYYLTGEIRISGGINSLSVLPVVDSQPQGLSNHISSIIPMSQGDSIQIFSSFSTSYDIAFDPEKSYAEFMKL